MCASFSSWFLFANHLSSRFSSIYLMISSINQSMMCQAYPNMINLSHYAAESARKQYEAIPVIWFATQTGKMGPSYSDGIARLDLAQEKDCVERTYQVRDFFYNVGNEVAKQRRKNKTFKDSYGFTIVLQIQFGFFPGSRNKQKQVILDSYYIEIFCCINNPSMTKLFRSR